MQDLQLGNVTLRAHPRFKGYFAADDGRIYSAKRGAPKALKPLLNRKTKTYCVSIYIDTNRYWRRLKSGKMAYCTKPLVIPVHRLIAELWLPPKPSPIHEINHKNFDRSDNTPTNIEWMLNHENIAHFQIANPNYNCGSSNRISRLTEAQVLAIRAERGILSQRQSAAKYGVGHQWISKIHNRRCWNHI